MQEKILKITLGVLFVIFLVVVGYSCHYLKSLPKEEKIVKVFQKMESEGSIRNRRFRDYEAIANGMMDSFDYEFFNLEMKNLEIMGIQSGVVAQIEDGRWMVITNELVPEAYHSGPAALFFSEHRPEEINK